MNGMTDSVATPLVPDRAGLANSIARTARLMASDATMPRVATVPLRLYLGAAFLNEIRHKIGPGTWSGWVDWMPGYIRDQSQHGAGLYHTFLSSVVVPHGPLFAALVALGELGVVVAMLMGATTRLGAAIGIVLTTNYALLNGTHLTDVSNDRALLVGFLVVLLTAPGRVFGIDAYLARRWPRCPLW